MWKNFKSYGIIRRERSCYFMAKIVVHRKTITLRKERTIVSTISSCAKITILLSVGNEQIEGTLYILPNQGGPPPLIFANLLF